MDLSKAEMELCNTFHWGGDLGFELQQQAFAEYNRDDGFYVTMDTMEMYRNSKDSHGDRLPWFAIIVRSFWDSYTCISPNYSSDFKRREDLSIHPFFGPRRN